MLRCEDETDVEMRRHVQKCREVNVQLHTRAFQSKKFLHANPCTHSNLYTQTLLHTDTFWTLSHTKTCIDRHLYTNAVKHRQIYTQALLLANAFTDTHRHAYAKNNMIF